MANGGSAFDRRKLDPKRPRSRTTNERDGDDDHIATNPPWQRGSNENTNGLLSQYLAEGTDLSKRSAEDLERIQRSLNGRPRETLLFMTPSEKLAELVALTG